MTEITATVVLKSGRDKSVRNHHPRLFSGALKEVTGKPRDGDVVDVVDNKGEWLARGVLNRLATTAVRILSWNADEQIDDAFFYNRIKRAVTRRERDPRLAHTNGRRIVFAESDGLPGLIADDYAGHIVAEFSALCSVQRRDVIIAALLECAQAKRVIERLDEERLRPEYGNNSRLIQSLKRDVPIEPALVEINDSQLRFQVDLANSQKTGFYLDQRDNRTRVGAYCVGANMLNLFSYSGAFAVNALAAGAQHATNVDVSQDALNLAAVNAALNGQETTQIAADVFAWLRANKNQGTAYDVIVLDPPKMAHNPSQIDKAARAYKDANRLAMGMLKPGGVLATFSCSGVVSADLLQQIVFSAGIEAKREVRIVERLSQASDHPVLTTYPESSYLKGLILRVE